MLVHAPLLLRTSALFILVFVSHTIEHPWWALNNLSLVRPASLHNICVCKPWQVLIDPVEANVTSTCRAVQRAVGVIGPHGGALANAIFMQPGGHVIELGPNPGECLLKGVSLTAPWPIRRIEYPLPVAHSAL